MAVLSLFHVFGLSSVLNTSVRFGAPWSWYPVSTPEPFWTSSRGAGAPSLQVFRPCSPPAAGQRRWLDLTALRLGICGGTPIAGDVIRALEQKFPTSVVLQG